MAGLFKIPCWVTGSEDHILSTHGTRQLTSQSQRAGDFDVMVTSQSQQAEDFDVTVTSQSQQAEDFDVTVTPQSQQAEDFDVTVTPQSQQAEDFDVTVTSQSQQAEDFDVTVTKNQSNGSLHAITNCTHPSVSLDMLAGDDRDILLTFSTAGDVSANHLTPLTCRVHLTSQPRYVISAVLLEHSLCGGDGGGVFVLLLDKEMRRSWDVCSAWQVPGPDYLTSSNEAVVSIEWTEVIHPFGLNISIKAMEKLHEGQLDVRYLSATEGEI